MIEDRERRERKNNLVIKRLKGKGKKNLRRRECPKICREKIRDERGSKDVQIVGGEGREVVIIRMDSWERKEEIMRRKKKLGSRKIYIDNDLSQEERKVQRKLREIARDERADGKRARVGYRRIDIEGQMYIWSEKENCKKEEFLKGSREKRVMEGTKRTEGEARKNSEYKKAIGIRKSIKGG